MIKDAIANSPNRLRLKLSSGLTCDRDPESIIHCILKFLFAPDVALSCLDRSVAKQSLVRKMNSSWSERSRKYLTSIVVFRYRLPIKLHETI
jgi:hypothetical protein